eukprot:TRINITY_DN9080_c0_g1_i2.p1 TRINITY_DN9080_c0_g1~~TRINITY_DN9080_c0_g1_i2.p1  ORF type:complete len:126 (+),score=28.94 TRINITY_DN9080_c0_g1_i2:410-787(+)
MNNPKAANDVQDLPLIPLTFDDVMKEEDDKELLPAKSIFAVEKMGKKAKSIIPIAKGREKVKLKERTKRVKRKFEECAKSNTALKDGLLPGPSAPIEKSKEKRVEMKMTGRLAIIKDPVFKFVKD